MPEVARLADVAERAGVSVALVSSYINTPHLVGAKSRVRIQKAIDQLNFVPNDAARQLRRGVSRMVAFVAYDVADPLFVSVARGAQRRAAEAGLSLVLADTNGQAEIESEYLQLFREQRVRGMLLSSVGDPEGHLAAAGWGGIPTVLIDQTSSTGRYPAVTVNDVLGGRLAVSHLLNLGRRHIAVVGGPETIPQVGDRVRGAREAAEEVAGASLEVVSTPGRDVADGRLIGQVLAKRSPSRRPEGVFCINDLLAAGLLEALRAEGLAVPGDVAVIGYNDTAADSASAAVPL